MKRGLTEILGAIFETRGRPKDNVPPPELALSVNGPSGGLYTPHPHAEISKSVLADPEGEENEAALPVDEAPVPASKALGIGQDLRVAEEAILEAGKALMPLMDQPAKEYIGRLLSLIETQLCQIAVIGQMNAGKSSLINALIGSPDFLPAEITPWTTVVTNLYFGAPNKPTSGAVFEFFNEQEWSQLAEGHGRVRTLTEQVMPDFPWDNLYSQVEEMRQRAEKTLGPQYKDLLGGKHEFETVTANTLERYIAAESPIDLDDGRAAGEYSMLTKAAHIFFDLSSFFYPTVVIDTPGINDPFLIRDEITRHNLERANIFIIVVTARQPLSNADLDLLRILRGLKKENLIIFVNKIDEIEDFELHRKPIVERIRNLLKQEIPDIDIPIITGSAYWADAALSNDIEELEIIDRENSSLTSPGALNTKDNSTFWLSDDSGKEAVLAESALSKSSIPDLGVAISNMLRSGPVAARLNHAAAALQAMAANGATLAKDEADFIRSRGASAEEAQISSPAVNPLKEQRQSADELIKQVATGYGELIGQAEAALKDQLDQQLKDILSSAAEIADNPSGISLAKVRNALLAKVRSGLEAELTGEFQKIVTQINLQTGETEQKLIATAKAAGEIFGQPVQYPVLPPLHCAPPLTDLSEPIITEIGGSASVTSWTKGLSLEEKKQLISAIESQFTVINGKLAEAARAELEQTTNFIFDHFRSNLLVILDRLIEQREKVAAYSADDISIGDAEVEARLAQLERELKSYDEIASTLAKVKIVVVE